MSIGLQKANFWKRISAYILDCILAVILTTGFASIVASISGYDKHENQLKIYKIEYANKYGIDEFDISEEDFKELSIEMQEKYEAAHKEYAEDTRALKTQATLFYLVIMIIALSLLLSTLVLYLIVPLLFKNGQTLGKKIFGLAVMRTHCVKLKPQILFVRSILGLYVMETMVPVFFVLMILFGKLGLIGIIMLFLLLVLQIGVMIYTKTNSSIHDLLSDTVVIEFASQQIFESEEALLAYKKAEHEKMVNDLREEHYSSRVE